jgi:hypothetical protein
MIAATTVPSNRRTTNHQGRSRRLMRQPAPSISGRELVAGTVGGGDASGASDAPSSLVEAPSLVWRAAVGVGLLSRSAEGTPPFPARTYSGTVRLLPLTDRAATVVEWSGFFDADGIVEDPVRSALEGFYAHFIAALAAAVDK